jgi:GxxExxY protein
MRGKDLTPEGKDPQTYAILGAAMEVHKVLKQGFLEAVYQSALEVELNNREIPFVSQATLPVFYKGKPLDKCEYRADFLCYGEVLVEIKALGNLGPSERAQVMNYLRATELQRALLINFGTYSLQYERIVL